MRARVLAFIALSALVVVPWAAALPPTISVQLSGTAGSGGWYVSDVQVTLHPRVRIAAGSDAALAAQLHARAHALCFIANSCSVPIAHQPEIATGSGGQ